MELGTEVAIETIEECLVVGHIVALGTLLLCQLEILTRHLAGTTGSVVGVLNRSGSAGANEEESDHSDKEYHAIEQPVCPEADS